MNRASSSDRAARWQTMLRDPRASGVWRVPRSFDVGDALRIASDNGWAHWRVNGRCTTRDELMDTFAEGCAFPAWFGRNYDALADCLRDLALHATGAGGAGGGGHGGGGDGGGGDGTRGGRGVLAWTTAGELAVAQPDVWRTMRLILDDTVRFYREHGDRFIVICVGAGGRVLPGVDLP